MKKITLSIIALAIAPFGMYSCKKAQMQTNETPTEQQVNEEDLAVINKIEAFKTSMKSKSTGEMNQEEALWHIEATMNYTYGEAQIALNDVDH